MVDGVIYMLPTPSSSTTQEIPREKKKIRGDVTHNRTIPISLSSPANEVGLSKIVTSTIFPYIIN